MSGSEQPVGDNPYAVGFLCGILFSAIALILLKTVKIIG